MTEEIKLDPTWLTVYEVDGSRIFVKAEEADRIRGHVNDWLRKHPQREHLIEMKTVEGSTYTIPVSRIVGWTVTTEKGRAYIRRLDEEFTIKEEPWE